MAKAPVRRNPLQQQQHEETRARIKKAALKIFFKRGYTNSSIEHVLKEASVSRAAFYSHFDGKLAIISAIADEYQPQWHPIFQYLADLQQVDQASLEHWARLYLQHQKQNLEICTLLTQVTILEDSLFQQIAVQREAIIEKLASNHPAFAAALTQRRHSTEAHVLLSGLNHICFLAAKYPDQHQEDIVIRILAKQMQDFLHPTS